MRSSTGTSSDGKRKKQSCLLMWDLLWSTVVVCFVLFCFFGYCDCHHLIYTVLLLWSYCLFMCLWEDCDDFWPFLCSSFYFPNVWLNLKTNVVQVTLWISRPWNIWFCTYVRACRTVYCCSCRVVFGVSVRCFPPFEFIVNSFPRVLVLSLSPAPTIQGEGETEELWTPNVNDLECKQS